MNDIANFIISELKPYEKYGKEIQENGTILIGKAPYIAPLAYIHSIFEKLKPEEIIKIEDKLKTKIPEDYKLFLKFTNGLHIFNGKLSLEGLRKNYNRRGEINARQPFDLDISNTYERPDNSSEELFFFGSYDKDGSMLCIDKRTNKVQRRNSIDGQILQSWINFSDFLKSEFIRLKSLHNEDGTEKGSLETFSKKDKSFSKKISFWKKIKEKFNS